MSERDPNLDHEAVKAYRGKFRFCPNAGFRRDIVATVTDLNLWQKVLDGWGYQKGEKWKSKNPLNVKGMLDEYEHQRRSNAVAPAANPPASHPIRSRESVWWWQGDRPMRDLQ